MNADREEFSARMREKAADRQAQAMPMIRAAVAVAPIMEKLMAGGEWDRFLPYIQARIDAATRAKVAAVTKLSDPSVYEPSEMSRLKTQIVIADSMIQAWEFAIGLPKALVQGGEEASRMVEAFEKKHESAKQPQP